MSETRPRIWDRWAEMPLPVRIGIAALALGTLAAFTVFARPAADQPLLPQRKWTQAELQSVERALRQAQIEPIRRSGNTLYVPANKLAEATAAAERLLADADESDDPLERSLRSTSLFTSPQQFQEIRDAALRAQLRRLLRTLPGIRDATVLWARDRNPDDPFAAPSVRATVSLLRDTDEPIGPHVLQSIRVTVAGAVPDVRPEDVAIVELQSGRVYPPPGQSDETHPARTATSEAETLGSHNPAPKPQADGRGTLQDAPAAAKGSETDRTPEPPLQAPPPDGAARIVAADRKLPTVLAAATGLVLALATTIVILRIRRRTKNRNEHDSPPGTRPTAVAATDAGPPERADHTGILASDTAEPAFEAVRQRVIARVAADPKRAAAVLARWCRADSDAARNATTAHTDRRTTT